MNTTTDNNGAPPAVKQLMDSIAATQVHGSSLLNTWRIQAEEQLLSDEISALKRSLLRHEIRRLSVAGLAARSAEEQKRNAGLLASQSLSGTMIASFFHSNPLNELTNPRSLPDTTGLVLTNRSALLGRTLRGNSPLLPIHPRLLHRAIASPILSSTACSTAPPPVEIFAGSDLLQDYISGQHPSSSSSLSIQQRTGHQTPPSTQNGIHDLLQRTNDYSEFAAIQPLLSPLNQSVIRIKMKRGRKFFPVVLHRVLAELELIGGGTKIASFLPDGNSFKIWDQFLFAKYIIPVFFPKMKNFASFQRQLNLYDFKRIVGACADDRGGYHHALFKRDSPELAATMKRRKIKGEVCATHLELLDSSSGGPADGI